MHFENWKEIVFLDHIMNRFGILTSKFGITLRFQRTGQTDLESCCPVRWDVGLGNCWAGGPE